MTELLIISTQTETTPGMAANTVDKQYGDGAMLSDCDRSWYPGKNLSYLERKQGNVHLFTM